MLPCDNSVIGGDMLSNQKPCSCILIFLARLPISLGCFSVSHPQSCAERPEGPQPALLHHHSSHTCTKAHALTQAHSASSTPLASGRMFNKGPFFYPFIFVSPVPPSPPPVSHQPASPLPQSPPRCGSHAPSHEHAPPGSSAMETLHLAGIQIFHQEGVAAPDFGREGCFLVG